MAKVSEGGRDRAPAVGDSRSLLRLEPAGASAVQVRWSVSAATWARLDSEFPGSAGATEPVLRLRSIRCNGTVTEVATERLAGLAAAHDGAIEVTLVDDGDYEAELGLATADGGWLVLMRSARWHWSRSAGGEPSAAGLTAPDDAGESSAPADRSARGEGPAGEASIGASSFYPPVWGLLPADMREPSTAEAPSPDVAGYPASAEDSAKSLSSHWGQGPAAAGYEAAPGGPVGVQVRTEVIVYGSAPAGTVVDLYGRSLRVGPGGAFSLRFDLTDPELLRRVLAEAPQIAPVSDVEQDEAD
ncbi:hypothetical protein Thimo_1105 [Thioflavicoccus mobilis 8321]|uniref:Uncharacterized protein n=1 Tax=Thioflavicoccus mobilis 8321 TaxID=765912 RepID=L0GT11_9GAMM|nr:hypothetical protein [Thioflavicoccus mobilis]AGA89908.1 hypothetical protein Thimo_1105 [Thioflavicoccus mobilis 8321]